MVYGIIAAFGVTLISDFIVHQQHWMRLVGGILLIILGYRTYHAHPEKEKISNGANNHTRAYLSTFLLTLTNPMTLFAFAAVFAGVGLDKIADDHWSASMLVAGVFLGSFLWFCTLTLMTRIFKEKVTTQGLVLINKIAGSLLILFGMVALGSGLRFY